MRIAVVVALLLAIATTVAAEDVVVLKDGHRVTGTIIAQTDKEVRIKVGDGEFILPTSLIAQIKKGDAPGEKPAPEKAVPDAGGLDVIKLRADGREIRGKIVAEDDSTITMKVGDSTLGFDKAVIEWVNKGGEVRRFGPTAEAPPTQPARPAEPARPAPSPGVRKWARVCLKHLVSDDPIVRRSASQALRALGPAARPALEAAAAGDDPRLAEAAKRVLEAGARAGGARRGPGGQRGQRVPLIDRLTEQLKLTDEQKPKVSAILEESTQKRRALFESMRNGDVPREEMRERMGEIQQDATTKLTEVLTEEQIAAYQEMMQRGRRRGGAGGRVPR